MNLKGVEAHLKATGSLPVNVKFLIEGEEEVGSANLDSFIAAHPELLKADVVLISDSPMFDRGIPSICYGLRGLVYMQIDLKGPRAIFIPALLAERSLILILRSAQIIYPA